MPGPSRIELRPFDPLTASAGEWAKLHALRRARAAEDYPGEPIRSINRRLGFTVHRRHGVYQVGPDELSRYLARGQEVAKRSRERDEP